MVGSELQLVRSKDVVSAEAKITTLLILSLCSSRCRCPPSPPSPPPSRTLSRTPPSLDMSRNADYRSYSTSLSNGLIPVRHPCLVSSSFLLPHIFSNRPNTCKISFSSFRNQRTCCFGTCRSSQSQAFLGGREWKNHDGNFPHDVSLPSSFSSSLHDSIVYR